LYPQRGLGQEDAAAGAKLEAGNDDHVWRLAFTTNSRYPPQLRRRSRWFTPTDGPLPPEPPSRRRVGRRSWEYPPVDGATHDGHAVEPVAGRTGYGPLWAYRRRLPPRPARLRPATRPGPQGRRPYRRRPRPGWPGGGRSAAGTAHRPRCATARTTTLPCAAPAPLPTRPRTPRHPCGRAASPTAAAAMR